MKKAKLSNIFLFSCVLFLFSFVFGYQLMENKLDIKRLDQRSNDNEYKNIYEDIEIVKEENQISPNTFVEERIHYKTCGHLVSEINSAKDEIINLDKKEFEEHLKVNYPSYMLISFSNVKVVLWEERNYLCKNHYVIGEEDGKIAIFTIGEEGEKVVDKVFIDYPLTLLIEIDQEKIKEGIVVDSVDELSEILENFIS